MSAFRVALCCVYRALEAAFCRAAACFSVRELSPASVGRCSLHNMGNAREFPIWRPIPHVGGELFVEECVVWWCGFPSDGLVGLSFSSFCRVPAVVRHAYGLSDPSLVGSECWQFCRVSVCARG